MKLYQCHKPQSVSATRSLLLCLTLASFGLCSWADNDAALQIWAESSGQAAPDVVPQGDGSTRLAWKHNASVDAYSSQRSGNSLLSAANQGFHSRFQWQSDVRSADSGNGLDWFMVGVEATDDASVLRHGWTLSTLQFGRMGNDYRVVMGDVPVEHSTLGARSDLRGLFFESHLGKLQVSGALGQQSETWRSLSEKRMRQLPVRDVYAVKLGASLGDALTAFATAQGYSDDENSVATAWHLTPQQRAAATTVGLDYAEGRLQVQAEAGVSRWHVSGAAPVNDSAHRIAASWQGERASVQAGHHDVGAAYAALSADVVPGVRENYVNGNWRTSDTLSLSAGFRRAKNSLLSGTDALYQSLLPRQADHVNAMATVDVPQVQGLQFMLSHQNSRGHNFDDSRLKTEGNGVTARYPMGAYTTTLGVQRNRFENGVTPLQDASANQVNTGLGWSNVAVEDASWRWNLFGQMNLQRQHFDVGTQALNRSFALSIDVQHERLGALRAAAQWGRLRNSASGGVIGRSFQLDVTTPTTELGVFKAYARVGQNSAAGIGAAAYKETVYGLQWLLAME